MCYKRREAEVKTLTHLEKPLECVNTYSHFTEKLKRNAAGLMKIPEESIVATEDLLVFESTGDESAFSLSLQTWLNVLKPFLGELLNESKVEAILREHQNTRPLQSHAEVIDNFESVKNIEELKPYLRLD